MLDFTQLAAFFLIFVRVTAFMTTAPIFAVKNVPALVKVGTGFILALLVFPVIETATPEMQQLAESLLGYILGILEEATVGLLLGIITYLIFNAVRVAGQFMDFQVGFAFSGVFDPLTAEQDTRLAQFMFLLGMLLFLTLDGHYALIRGICESFQVLPLAAVTFQDNVALIAVRAFAMMFAIALQMALPVIAVVVITDLALGFVGRTAPQMNIFMLGFPLKIATGIIMLSIIVPLLGVVFKTVFGLMEKYIYLLLEKL